VRPGKGSLREGLVKRVQNGGIWCWSGLKKEETKDGTNGEGKPALEEDTGRIQGRMWGFGGDTTKVLKRKMWGLDVCAGQKNS